ncbi:hypothetical protein [Bacillus mycoides]|nr:hypothetical protein [Bacillus mycoides]WOA60783.1 hypothetical protein RVY74_30120 [Bacillus mycoides]
MKKEQVVALLSKDYQSSIGWQDKIEEKGLMMSDMIFNAFIKQFV